MSPIRGRRPARWVGATTAVLALAMAVSAAPPALPVGAQGAPSAWARLVDLEASCGEADLAISGTLDLDVPEGASVAHRYEVGDGSAVVPLGDDDVTATAPTARHAPFVDDIWFGPRWTGGLPFTYVQETVVRVGGDVTYEQRVEARCTELYGAATLTVTESVPPSPTSSTSSTSSTTGPTSSSSSSKPGPGPGSKLVPRYAG
jgi:hypothetical protein